MPGLAYVDSSALLKLALHEPEESALESDFLARRGLVASALVALECRRAARRHSDHRAAGVVEDLLDAVYLLEMTPAILDRAARVDPPRLRSLDAIHLATALSIDAQDNDLEVITYDIRLAEAAAANGLRVVRPGPMK